MKSRLLLWSVTASLAGFLFGFDTIVISGAEEDFQRLWQLDGFWHGLFQFNIVFGILVAFASNWIVGNAATEAIAWRLMLGLEAVPALIYTILSSPQSP